MQLRFIAVLACLSALSFGPSQASADASFQKFIAGLWPEAQAQGISRTTFDAATRGLTPDLSLSDLEIPGRKPPPQPEFTRTPAQYLDEAQIARFAAQGRRLAAEHKDTLARIEREFGVPGEIILAIWARETSYGGFPLPHDAVRALATQAWLGRRKEMFREQFVLALKILEEGHVARADMKSSWAGAMGHMQFLPSDFFRYAVDFTGDGKRDIWNSVPDALAAGASQLVGKGWLRGRRWAHEVRVPENVDCSVAEPGFRLPVGEWVKHGFTPAYDRRLSPAELTEEASLLMPEGRYGPAFLTPRNYFVLKEYNFSDLYVLFVGHLSDRIAGGKPFETPWSKTGQLRMAEVAELQRLLAQAGYYDDKIDGMAGMFTRSALGRYQKAHGLTLDCWPALSVLEHLRRNVRGN